MRFTISARRYKEAVARANEREATRRDRYAHSLVSLGLVRRTPEGFRVCDIRFRSLRPSYNVWRDAETRRVTCDCEELEQRIKTEPAFRCAHILGVKYFLEERTPVKSGSAQVIPFDAEQKPERRASAGATAPLSRSRNRERLANKCTWGAGANTPD